MESKLLRSIIPCFEGKQLCQPLITTREFGRWIEEAYSTKNPELVKAACYITSAAGTPYHPGAPINGYFSKRPVINKENRQRSFVTESEVITYLVKNGMSQYKDANKLVGSDNTTYNVIKLYTKVQVELFLRYLMNDRQFELDSQMAEPELVNCVRKPTWLFDENEATAVDSRFSLFGTRDKKAEKLATEQEQHFQRLAIIRNRYADKDLMAFKVHACGNEIINLYKMNTRKLGWEYIRATYNVPLREIYFEQGSPDWYDAKIRRDGNFTLGKGVLSDKFPDMIAGRYAMEYIKEQGRFVVYVDGWMQPIIDYRKQNKEEQ